MRADPLAFLGDELDSLKRQNLYRRFRILEDEQKAHATFDHRSVVNLSSNNYLGLTTHPRLRGRGWGVRLSVWEPVRTHQRRTMESTWSSAPLSSSRSGGSSYSERFTGQRRTVSASDHYDASSRTQLNHAASSTAPADRATIKVFPHKYSTGAFHVGPCRGSAPAAHHGASSPWTAIWFPCGALRSRRVKPASCWRRCDASGVFGADGRGTIDHFACTAASSAGPAVEANRRARRHVSQP